MHYFVPVNPCYPEIGFGGQGVSSGGVLTRFKKEDGMKGRWIQTVALATVMVVAMAVPVLAFEPGRVTCIAPANPGGETP